MRIESLSLFLLVAEKGSISQAARQAYISQQGASAVIKSLEHEFGMHLFDRGSNDLRLTPAGRRLADEAEQVVSAYRRLQTVAALGDTSVSLNTDPLKVVTTPFTTHVISSIFDAYQEATGMTRPIEFVEKTLFEILDEYPRLDPEALYLINVPSFMTGIQEKIGDSFKPLVISDLMLYCSSDSPYARRKTLERSDLKGAHIACYSEALLERLIHNMIKDVEDASIKMRTTNLVFLQNAVIEQNMVSLTDSLSVFLGTLPNSTAVIPIKGCTLLTTGILGEPQNEQAHNLATFMENYLATVCAEYMKRFPLDRLASAATNEVVT